MNIYDSMVTVIELSPWETLLLILGLIAGAYIIYDVIWRIQTTRRVYREELRPLCLTEDHKDEGCR